METTIHSVLSKFSTEKLEKLLTNFTTILPVTREEVRSAVGQRKLNWNKKNAVSVTAELITEKIKSSAEGLEGLEGMILDLKLLDVVMNRRIFWNWVEFPGNAIEDLDVADIERRISQIFRRRQHNLVVRIQEIELEDSLLFGVVAERKRAAGVANFSSYKFFVVPRNWLNHALFSVVSDQLILKAVSEALGFRGEFNPMSLNGRDVETLYGMIKRSLNPQLRSEIPEYVRGGPVVEGNDVDYTERRQRMEYAEAAFPHPTSLSSFTVKANVPVDPDNKSNPVHYQAELTFEPPRGQTVEDFMKSLIADGHMRLPLPKYVTEMANSASNEFTIS